MKYIYAAFAILAIFGGLVVMLISKGAVHEVEALVLFLIAAVLFVAAEVSEGFSNLDKLLQPKEPEMAHEPGITSQMIDAAKRKQHKSDATPCLSITSSSLLSSSA